MSIRRLRSFSTELMKIASEILDADVRMLLAERRGDEYLPGGQLPSNDPRETNFVPKIAAYMPSRALMASNMMGSSINLKNEHPAGKAEKTYLTGRDYLSAGVRGTTAGLGALAAAKTLLPEKLEKAMTKNHKAYGRLASGIGVASMLGDLTYRRHKLKQLNAHREKRAFVQANPNASFGSPATQLANSRRVGSFEAGRIHTVRPQLPRMPKV